MNHLENSFNFLLKNTVKESVQLDNTQKVSELSKQYQKVAKLCQINAQDAPNQFEDDWWTSKSNEMIDMAKNLSKVFKIDTNQNTDEFKTDFKFASKEERTLYQRFVEGGKRLSGNKYMYYTVTDTEHNYRTAGFKYFFDLNENVLHRFDEITNYEYVIADKNFLLNNDFKAESSVGKRYVYYVDANDFNESSKNPMEHSVLSKVFRFAKVFRSYEALLEHLETNVKNKAIYVIGENAFNGLRYVIDSIEMVICETLKIEDTSEMVKHNFDNYKYFLGFGKQTDSEYTQKEKVMQEIEKKEENFSNFIRFSTTSKTKIEVEKDVTHKLVKFTRSGLKPTIYRWARRAKMGNEHSRFIQIQNVILELDDKNKLKAIIPNNDENIKESVNYITTGKFLTNGLSLTKKESVNFHADTIEEISKVIQIQIIG